MVNIYLDCARSQLARTVFTTGGFANEKKNKQTKKQKQIAADIPVSQHFNIYINMKLMWTRPCILTIFGIGSNLAAFLCGDLQ